MNFILFTAGWGTSQRPWPRITDATLTGLNFSCRTFICECKHLNKSNISANFLLRNSVSSLSACNLSVCDKSLIS